MADKTDKTKESSETIEETSPPEELAQESNEELTDSQETTSEEPTADEADATTEEAASEESSTDEEEANAEESADADQEEVDGSLAAAGGDEDEPPTPAEDEEEPAPGDILGVAAFFDLPDDLLVATAHTRDKGYKEFDAFSPFPIDGMNDALGAGRSWLPWVTFGAGSAGFLTANALQFGTMTFDWPMIIGGKPYAPWPSFIPVMFEMTVLFAGITTVLTMFIASGCFRKPLIIDPEITKDRFALWISADDETFDIKKVREFMRTLDPVEIRTITKGA